MIETKEQKHQRMTQTPIPRLVISLAIPTVCSQLITTLYNAADTYFVAKIGTSATGAVGVVFAVMSLIQAVGFGTGMGAGSIISRLLGARQEDEANRFANSALAAAFLFGVFLCILGQVFMHPLMKVLGSTETILPFAISYARYILAVAPIMTSAFVLNNLLRFQGEAKLAMYGLCTGGILNMILDPIFIFTFHMGIAGAAIATAISQCISFLLLLRPFLVGKTLIKLDPRMISRNPGDYLKIYKTGMPTICRQGLGSLSTALLNVQAAAFNDDAVVAAVTIANKIYMLVRNIVLGIGQAFMPIAGYNYGAGRKDRVTESFSYATKLGTLVGVAAALILGLNARLVITLFRADDPAVIAIGTRAIQFSCAVMPFMGFSTYVNQIFQALGINFPATFLASCRQGICFIPLVFLLPLTLKTTGVIMVQPGADFLTFLIAIPFLIHLFGHQLRIDPKDANEVNKNA